jgi:predicted small lipoprotein YifL
MTRRRQLLALLLATPVLAGCGRRGDLRLPDRPQPAPVEESPAPVDENGEDPGT